MRCAHSNPSVERKRRRALACLLLLAVCSPFLPSCLPKARGAQPSVVISEFMAVNGGALADRDGDPSDWIEVHNQGATDVDLEGWYLTDDRRDPAKWRFPQTTLPADGYLVVFASGKDRAVAGSELHTSFRLSGSEAYLALVEPSGTAIAWEYAPTYPQQFENVSYGLVAGLQERYLLAPTPGALNGVRSGNQGVILSAVRHTPALPNAGDALWVTASVEEVFAPVRSVTLHWRVMHGATTSTPMYDDGEHGDGAAQDGTYGATIPGRAYRPGEMVRYYVTATDRADRVSRWPLFADPANSPEYLGTMIADPDVVSELPVLYWFVADPEAAESDSGTRASVFYDGLFYDNVFVRRRGRVSKSWLKRGFRFDFNQGHHFRFSPDQDPVEEFNLNSTYSDKAYIRQLLAWETFRDAGVPYCVSFPMRVQQNGDFYSVAIFVEQPGERYLERQGLDPNGALYKVTTRNAVDSSTEGVQKETRLDEDHSDLQALVDGVELAGEERVNYLYDHVSIPSVINCLAVATIIHDRDFGHKNYYLYRDTQGSGEWTILPWDKDLTFGRLGFLLEGGVLNDAIWANHDPESHPLKCYTENLLFDALYDVPAIRDMYLRRLRTLMDELLQPPGTPPSELRYERRIDAYYEQMLSDVTLDADRWPVLWGTPQTFAQALDILKNDYLAVRRVHLYETHGPGNGGVIPAPQPATARVFFGDLEPDPASGNQSEEYFTLVNPNDYAVDISGWQIAQDVEYTIQPGVVIPAGGTLYLSPDVVAFRNRATSPTGDESHFVQGNYRGRLSNTWGVLRLYDHRNRLVATKVFFD
jgi:hypothetical protein